MNTLQRIPLPLASSALIMMLGCFAPDPPAGAYPPLTREEHEASCQDGGAPSSEARLTVDGTWLLWHESSTCVHVGAVDVETISETLALVQLDEQQDSVVHHTIKSCVIEQSPITGMAIEIPRALIDALPPRSFLGILDGQEPGSGYATEKTIELWGMQLQAPASDALPTESSDPRVVDQDGDGNTGVTVLVGDGACMAFLVRRRASQWKGSVEGATRISGSADDRTEVVVLQSSGGFCHSEFYTWTPQGADRFVLERADGKHGAADLDLDRDGRVTCGEIEANGTASFGPREPDNERCRNSK